MSWVRQVRRLIDPPKPAIRSDQSGFDPQASETNVSCIQIDGAVGPSNQHEAPMCYARDPSSTTIAHSPSLKIADSNNEDCHGYADAVLSLCKRMVIQISRFTSNRVDTMSVLKL